MTDAPERSSRVRSRRLIATLALVATILGGLFATSPVVAADSPSAAVAGPAGPALAADLSQFRPGNIISDAVFFNSGTMSEAQIQAFIQSKAGNCQSGYTCLKDWYDTSRAVEANAMCGAYSGGWSERASTIIYKVAQACGINPQVILVTLQKEQSLITHTSPSRDRYKIAMGQGCPDTAACDVAYHGFFNQVYGAARQFKRYANPPGTSQYFTWYPVGRVSNIGYNPNAACGSSPVLIENQATAGLYYYTPYQPNAAALRAGYGLGDGCSAYGNRNFYQYFTDWFGSTQGGDPFGNIELVESVPGGFRVRGWAIDPNTTAPIEVHVYVGANGYPVVANGERSDVGAAYPASGSRHGFDAVVPAAAAGAFDVCLYAINSGPGTNRLLGCVSRVAMTGSPIGSFEAASAVEGGIEVSGWALDPDSAGAAEVHVYVGAAGYAIRADVARADVAAAYPGYGASRGFRSTVPAAPGTHQVCAYALNVGVGATANLGCRTVAVAGQSDLGRPPIGSYDSLTVSGQTATVRGWAIDPDTTRAVTVRVSVNGAVTEFTANRSRPDVALVHPAYGSLRGFQETLALPIGVSDVCVELVNTGAGGNTSLGCRSVSVEGPDLGRNPVGNFEALSLTGSVATATGWALDPDTSASIAVHLYVNGAGREYIANKPRPDVGAAYPANGAAHGFSEQITLPDGRSEVCAYGINTGRGSNTFLGCRAVTVATTPISPPPPVAGPNRAPLGYFESVAPVAGGAAVAGWALDPDTSAAIEVHIYAGATGRAMVASKTRPDVGAAYGLGDGHGFSDVFPLPAGVHRLCAYAIDTAGGANPLIGCRDVRVP